MLPWCCSSPGAMISHFAWNRTITNGKPTKLLENNFFQSLLPLAIIRTSLYWLAIEYFNIQTFTDFGQIRESLSREKFRSPRSAKVYVCEIFQNRPSAKVNVQKKFSKRSSRQTFHGHGRKKKSRLFFTILLLQ